MLTSALTFTYQPPVALITTTSDALEVACTVPRSGGDSGRTVGSVGRQSVESVESVGIGPRARAGSARGVTARAYRAKAWVVGKGSRVVGGALGRCGVAAWRCGGAAVLGLGMG